MKRILFAFFLCVGQTVFSQPQSAKLDSLPTDSFYMLAPASVRAVRVGENAPFAKSNLSKKELQLLLD